MGEWMDMAQLPPSLGGTGDPVEADMYVKHKKRDQLVSKRVGDTEFCSVK
jgi:hypothetical protein